MPKKLTKVSVVNTGGKWTVEQDAIKDLLSNVDPEKPTVVHIPEEMKNDPQAFAAISAMLEAAGIEALHQVTGEASLAANKPIEKVGAEETEKPVAENKVVWKPLYSPDPENSAPTHPFESEHPEFNMPTLDLGDDLETAFSSKAGAMTPPALRKAVKELAGMGVTPGVLDHLKQLAPKHHLSFCSADHSFESKNPLRIRVLLDEDACIVGKTHRG